MVLSTVSSSPFGSRSRTRILVALRLLGSSYPRALARLLGTPIFAVRKALAGLERDGLVANRLVGRTRLYTLSPAYLAHRELAAFLWRLAELDGPLAAAMAADDGTGTAPSRVPPAQRALVEPDTAPPTRAARPPAGDGWKNW